MRIRKSGVGGFACALAIMIAASALVGAGAIPAAADTCCFPDGTCQDGATQGPCIAAGGAFFSGVTCTFHPCPPIGACCEADGSCTISAEQGCINRGGVWQGATTTCATSCLPEPTRKCCFPDGSCIDLTAEDCAAAGGVYDPFFSCALHPCPPPQGDACPRTAGFWSQQCLCAQGEGGRVKFDCEEMDDITGCAEGKSSFFAGAWGDAFDGFCATVNPTGMDQRKQAKRQFAVLLANVCAGELGIEASNGDVVSLPEGTPIDACANLTADTIGELIDEVDDLLADLEGEDLTQEWVKNRYTDIITCAGGINNGIGVPLCGDAAAAKDDDSESFAPASDNTSWGRVKGIYR